MGDIVENIAIIGLLLQITQLDLWMSSLGFLKLTFNQVFVLRWQHHNTTNVRLWDWREEGWGQPQDQPQLVNLQYNINIQEWQDK